MVVSPVFPARAPAPRVRADLSFQGKVSSWRGGRRAHNLFVNPGGGRQALDECFNAPDDF